MEMSLYKKRVRLLKIFVMGKVQGVMDLLWNIFKVFWKQLGFIVISLDEGFSKGALSSTQKDLIICIPKVDQSID